MSLLPANPNPNNLTRQQLEEYVDSLYPLLFSYALSLVKGRRDLGFDSQTAEEWASSAMQITLDASRTRIRTNIKATYFARSTALQRMLPALRVGDANSTKRMNPPFLPMSPFGNPAHPINAQ